MVVVTVHSNVQCLISKESNQIKLREMMRWNMICQYITAVFGLVLTLPAACGSSLVSFNLSGNAWMATTPGLGVQLKATVPGSMYTDLLANGQIKDPYNRFNDINYAMYGERDWQYWRNFMVNSTLSDSVSVDLVCYGIDTVSAIYINGKSVGKTDNQFIKYRFPVRNYLKLGSNEIRVKFMSAVHYAASQSSHYPYTVPPMCPPTAQHGQCHPNFIRKEQASFSWDWGPSFPTQGIWKDIALEGYDKLILEDFSVEVTKLDADFWNVHILGYILGVKKLTQAQVYRVDIVLRETGQNKTYLFNMHQNSSDVIEMSIMIDRKLVKQWWPNGYGQQPLYGLSVSLSPVIDSSPIWRTKMIGFRTVELIQQPIKGAIGLSFYFKVNGMPIFMKGSNWIPADSFQSRITKEKLRNLLTSTKLAHMNMLRVWGGGIYEQDEFYHLADEMGILIWQDVMFACAMYPTDSQFLDNVKLEVTQQVRRLKHHPSLALWAGNNENEAALRDNWYNTTHNFTLYKSDYIKLYIDTVQATVNKEHSSGIFVSSSPSNAAQSEKEGWVAKNPYDPKFGDVHYYNYSPGRYYTDGHPRSRFLSEYGYQSWPSFQTLEPFTLSQDWNEFSDFALNRNHHAGGQMQIHLQLQYYFNPPTSTDLAKNFSNYIYLTQVNQAMYIRMVSEFCRRSQSYLYGDEGMTMGALYWQLNDIWPGASWSSIDFSGKWKMLHYYAKKFFAPNMMSMAIESDNLTIYIIQDITRRTQPTSLTLSCYSWLSFNPQSSYQLPVKLLDQVSNRVFNENLDQILQRLRCTDRQSHFLYASWQGALQTEFVLSPYKNITELGKPTIKATLTGSFPILSLILITDKIAPFVWVDTDLPGVLIQDNGFLLKDAKMVVNITLSKNIPVTTNDFKITSLMDIYN